MDAAAVKQSGEGTAGVVQGARARLHDGRHPSHRLGQDETLPTSTRHSRTALKGFAVDLQLAGTNVLVTGAGQGLGLAIGQAFVAEGANVAVSVQLVEGRGRSCG